MIARLARDGRTNAGIGASSGGLGHWDSVTGLTAKLSHGGPFWELRGRPGVYAGLTVTLETRREHIAFAPFTAPHCTSVLDVDPVPSGFDDFKTTWDAVQVAYLASAATWNYLMAPFVFTYAGVTAEVADHNPDQVFHYDERFMLRRMD